MKCKCKCGNEKFNLNFGKLECGKCGKWLNPFSTEEHKIMKPNGRHYFWGIFTPTFLERLEKNYPDTLAEELLNDCLKIEKASTQSKIQCCKWRNSHIYWKYYFNHQLKRLELKLISLTSQKQFTTKYYKNVEVIEVNFS